MSHLSTGLISAYNSLTDKHLAGYFSNTRIRRHLQRAGLITRSGRIVPDKEYRHKLIQRAHQRHVRECLAQAIFHKVLEMERVHQIEIKRKLEEFARRERVHKIKVERSKRYEEELIRILSPRPPTGARGIRKQHSGPEGEHSESSESPSSSRPNTAPGKMQRPVRLKPIHSNSTTASLRRSSPYRHHESSTENNQTFNCRVHRESRRHFNPMEASNGISPYCLPVINNFVTPVPPPTKRRERALKVNPSGTLRGRRLRPTTASSGADITEDPPMLRSSVHQSRVSVNMIYCGKTVHLSHDLSDMRDEVKVFQQHCGGENLCVYKGRLQEGDTFQFISRRHRGFPFSLTFFLNGLQVERLSSCCEFKHRKGSRLGGRHGHFGFCSVEGASPCYKCIIAMGLDKKPTPPPKRVRESRGKEELLIIPKEAPEMRTERTERTERSGSHSEHETSQAQDMETQVKGMTAAEVRDDYEEDFEADDEGPAEDPDSKVKKSPSPSVDMRTAKEREASETEDDNEKDDIKSHSGSSSSGSEREESDTEATPREEDKAEQPKEVDEEESAAPPDDTDEPQPEETPATEAESAAPKDSDVPNSAGESTEIDISDTSVPPGNENKQSDDTSGEKEVDKIEHESKQEEEQERAKSVQEKLAEAILKESQRSSEPELSDTSTDDTVESAGRGHDRDHKDADSVKSATTTEQQKIVEEERTCEEGAAALALALLDQQTKQAGDTEQNPTEIRGTAKDKEEEADEEDKNVASEEEQTPAETNKLDEIETAGAALLALSTAVTIVAPEAVEDVADKPSDATEKIEEKADETGQGAKSSKEDESSASESNKETDETAVTDNTEAEAATASATMEIKAEPSEEREALSCEEAPVTGTETSQLGDHEDRAAGTKTEESGDSTDDKNADISEDNTKEESTKDEVSEDRGDLREEQTEKSDLIEEEKQKNADETTEGEHGEESKVQCKDQTEDEMSNESKAEEKAEKNSKEEQAEKQVEKEEEAGRLEKTENDEDVKNKNDDEELMEEAAAAVILAAAAGTMSATIAAADETKEEQIGSKAEQSYTAKNQEESQETKVVTCTTVEVEKSTEKEKEPQDRKDADVDEDDVKKSDEDMETEDAVTAALLTVVTAGMLNTMEAEDGAKKSEEGGDDRGKREVDAENGEESKPQGDEGEAPTLEEDGVTAEEQIENERKTEEPAEGEITAESAEKQEHVKSVSASDSAEAKEDDNVEKQHQPGENDSELEKSDTGLNEESESNRQRDGEETQDENTNLSEPDYETLNTKESNDIQENIQEVTAVSLVDPAQSTTPTAADSDDARLRLERSTALSDHHTDKHPNTEENTAATDLSAADGDNGDTEEASKASEEGASVLLKPQAQSEQPEQQNEAEKEKEEKDAVIEETAEVLAREDLVTNWVTMHQTSKFFETFVEPLEDLKEEVTQPTELQRSVSPPEESETVKQEHTPKDVKEVEDKNKEESEELEVESKGEKDKEKDALQEQEETEAQDLILKTESGPAEDLKERQGSLEEDKGEEATTQENIDQGEVSNTIVESIARATPSVTSGRPESFTEDQSEEKTAHNAELSEKQATELLPSKAEDQPQHLVSPDFRDQDDTPEKSQGVTEISEFTESRSDDGSQKVPHQEDIKPKVSDANINGERKDLQLIQDIKHTLSKERLSTFSVDETLFAPNSYPLLAAAQTESGH